MLPKSKDVALDAYNSIAVVNGNHKLQTLFFSVDVIDPQTLARCDLPPIPPEGGFDARFASNRFLECASNDGERIIPIEVRSDRYPITMRWDIKEGGTTSVLVVDGSRIPLRTKGNITISKPDGAIGLLLQRGIDLSLPREYALEQNYPNPFNPTTAIRYQLPATSHVSLTILNILGQEIEKLVDEDENAGTHSRTWTPTIASGVYFYKLQARDLISGSTRSFVDLKKMLLLR